MNLAKRCTRYSEPHLESLPFVIRCNISLDFCERRGENISEAFILQKNVYNGFDTLSYTVECVAIAFSKLACLASWKHGPRATP